MNAIELRAALEADGWRFGKDAFARNRKPDWYAWKRAKTRNCECNSKPPAIVIYPSDDVINGHQLNGMEIEICGEIGGRWYKFLSYGMKIGTDEIESASKALIRAWEAL